MAQHFIDVYRTYLNVYSMIYTYTWCETISQINNH